MGVLTWCNEGVIMHPDVIIFTFNGLMGKLLTLTLLGLFGLSLAKDTDLE